MLMRKGDADIATQLKMGSGNFRPIAEFLDDEFRFVMMS